VFGHDVGVTSCRRLLGASVAVLAAAAVTVMWPAGSQAGASRAWVDRGLHVVGGPVAAGDRIVVLASAPDRSVWL